MSPAKAQGCQWPQAPIPSVLLCEPPVPDASTPTQCCPFHQLLSAPCGTVGATELLSCTPCAGQQNPKELEKGAGGPGWDAMAIFRGPQHGFSCCKGLLVVCLSSGVMGLPGHSVMDGTRGCVSVLLRRQSLRGGEGCNKEIGVNLINWWVACIKNTFISDEGSAHRDISCDLHTIPKAMVR